MAAPGDNTGFFWPVLTLDRTGLYSKIYDNVFATKGSSVDVIPCPVLRCKHMVAGGSADFFPGGVKNELLQDYSFITPKVAIWYTEGIAVIFKKTTIPKWQGIDSLKGMKIVSAIGTDHIQLLHKYKDKLSFEIQNAYENQTPKGALKMTDLDFMDVYISSIELLKVAMSNLGDDFRVDEYQIESIGRQKFYPLFQNNQRGKELAEIFDNGMQKLHNSGQLKIWFEEDSNASIENIDPLLKEQ